MLFPHVQTDCLANINVILDQRGNVKQCQPPGGSTGEQQRWGREEAGDLTRFAT